MAGSASPKDASKRISGQGDEATSRLPHELTFEELAKEIGADTADGLTAEEAKLRLTKYGKNELDGGEGVSPFKILLRQVANAMTLVS